MHLVSDISFEEGAGGGERGKFIHELFGTLLDGGLRATRIIALGGTKVQSNKGVFIPCPIFASAAGNGSAAARTWLHAAKDWAKRAVGGLAGRRGCEKKGGHCYGELLPEVTWVETRFEDVESMLALLRRMQNAISPRIFRCRLYPVDSSTEEEGEDT